MTRRTPPPLPPIPATANSPARPRFATQAEKAEYDQRMNFEAGLRKLAGKPAAGRPASRQFATRAERDAYYRQRHAGNPTQQNAADPVNHETEVLSVTLPNGMVKMVGGAVKTYNVTASVSKGIWNAMAFTMLAIFIAMLVGAMLA